MLTPTARAPEPLHGYQCLHSREDLRACYGKAYYTALPSPRDPKPQFVSTPLRISAACHRGHVPRIDNTAPCPRIPFPTIQTHPSIFGPLSLDVKKSMYFPAKSNYLERLFKNSDPLTLLRHPGGALRCKLEPYILKTWETLGILTCSRELRDRT